MADGVKTPRVRILGRRHGNDNNITNVECNAFDMSEYVEVLRMCYDDRLDYFVVEPVIMNQTFF